MWWRGHALVVLVDRALLFPVFGTRCGHWDAPLAAAWLVVIVAMNLVRVLSFIAEGCQVTPQPGLVSAMIIIANKGYMTTTAVWGSPPVTCAALGSPMLLHHVLKLSLHWSVASMPALYHVIISPLCTRVLKDALVPVVIANPVCIILSFWNRQGPCGICGSPNLLNVPLKARAIIHYTCPVTAMEDPVSDLEGFGSSPTRPRPRHNLR